MTVAQNAEDFAKCATCRGDCPPKDVEIKGVVRTKGCLYRMVTDTSRNLLSLYSHYKAGHLLCAGGVGDQPAAYVDAMQIIDTEVNSGD